jgi:MoaA/NifB/PqqE/SkfB family radical SAM enzyme
MAPAINNFNADEKILRYVDKLDYFFNGHKTLIVTEFDLTNRCNNKCPGCCGVNENGAELSRHQIDLIVRSLAGMENQGVILSGGGEPLISPHFSYAVRELRKNGMKLGLNSNGLALTEDLAVLIAENCEYFRISLDAATPELYRKTHGMPPAAFEKTVENIRLFSRVKRELQSPVSFGVGFLTSRETAPEMEAFVALVKERGADFAQFRPFTGDLYDATEEYLRLKEAYETPEFGVRASLQKYREMGTEGKRSYDRCRGMFFSTVVTADAKVFACLHYRQNDAYYLGQITDETSLEDIFKSARMREVYASIDCSQCPAMCRNDVFNRTLDTLSLDVTHREFL